VARGRQFRYPGNFTASRARTAGFVRAPGGNGEVTSVRARIKRDNSNKREARVPPFPRLLGLLSVSQ
jgi:hypothetical protein